MVLDGGLLFSGHPVCFLFACRPQITVQLQKTWRNRLWQTDIMMFFYSRLMIKISAFCPLSTWEWDR